MPRAGASPGASAVEEDGTDEVGAIEELAGRAREADLTLLEEVRAFGDLERERHRLLDEQHRRAGFGELAHHGEQALDDDRREPERELVEQQEPWPRDERHREVQHLLLATRQVSGPRAETLPQLGEVLEGPIDVVAVAVAGRVAPPVPRRESEVLARR